MAVNQFLTALKKVQPFPEEQFINRLYNKARLASNVSVYQAGLPPKPAYGPDPNSMFIDGVDQTGHLQLLAEQAAVKGLSRYAPSADTHNLRGCANTANAQITADALFNQTSTMLYSEHINWSLTAGGSADLKALRANVQFVNDLDTELKNPHFITGAVRQDLINGDHTYTTALLFTYDYVHLGPGFVPHLDGTFASAPSGQLLTQWMPNIFTSDLSLAQKSTVALTLGKATSLVHGVTTPSGTVMQSVAPAMQFTALASMKIVQPAQISGLEQLTSLDQGTWKAIADQNQVLWDNTDENWASAIISVASRSTSETQKVGSDGQAFGEGVLIGLTLGLEDHQNFRTTTITGQDVANWINQGRAQFSSLFNSNAPSVVDTHDFTTDGPVKPSGGCFIAGTQVAIQGGSIAIERIKEGTKVLTRADPEAYGIASDEDVVTLMPLGLPLLCGINGETPFFTPGHVFYTTAGLKAVDPSAAKEENSWLEVGKLAEGHILYRLSSDGEKYDQVEVKSISFGKTTKAEVYGVHLREGQRSYHANGYLVAVNYPEITVKSIAKMLATFPRHVQSGMLYHMNELKPLFHKFGVATISDVLKKEIRGAKRRPVAAPVPRRDRRRLTSNLGMAKRSYKLHHSGSHNVNDYQLPILSIHEGTVSLDGEAQHRAIVDKSNRTIRWTRPVPEHGFEHGFVDVNNHGLAGHGAVILSQEPNLATVPPQDSADHKVVKFQAAKPNVNIATATKTLDHEQMKTTLNTLADKKVAIASKGLFPTLATNSFKIPDFPKLPWPINIPGLNIPGTTPAKPTPTPPATTTPAKPTPAPTPAPAPAPKSVASAPINPDYIDNEDYWDLTLDQAVWPVGQTKTGATNPMAMGQVAFATYHAEGKNGLSIPILTVPALDTLLTDVNKTLPAGQTQLTSLYSSMVEITSDGSQLGQVFLDSAPLLYQLADKPSGSTTLSSMLNVTFKGIGSSVKLPILFRTLGVQLSSDFMSAKGAVTEYNASNRGADGDRHWVQDSDSTSFATVAKANRAFVSKSLAVARPQPVGMTTSLAASPAPVTKALSTQTDLSVDQLTGMNDYNSVKLHDTSQTLLQNVMLYHMNANDRETFIQVSAPGNLPVDLTSNLPANLKTWIQNTYGPAFISFMIAQTKAKDVSWRDPLSDDEISKIWYWWNGQGKNCLSMTSEYNQLNALTSVYAMRQLYADTLNPFLQSPDPQGPTYWANQMYASLTGNVHAKNGVLRKPINGGESILNKYTNIMLALDPTSKIADSYFDAIVGWACSQNIQNPYFPLDAAAAEQQKEWLNDSMKQLILLVLNNDPSVGGDIGASLKDDLNNFMKAENIDETAAAELKAEEIIAKSAELVGNIVQYMGLLGDGLSAIGRCNGFKGAAAVVNKGLAKLNNAGGFPFLKGAFLLVTVAGDIFQAVNTFTKWDSLTGSQRAIAIISTISMVVDIAGKSYELYKDIKTWNTNRKNVELTPEEASKGEVLDQQVQDEIQSQDGMDKVNDTNKQVNGGRDVQDEFMANVSNETQENRSANIVDEGLDDIVPGNNIAEEEKLPDPPADLPVGARDPWKAFSTSDKVLKCANIAVGVAFTIAMSIDLKDNWDNYTDAGKVLNVIQIVIQGLTVLLDVALLVGDAAIAAGVMAADCAMMVALPILGAILAVVGIVVMILLSTLDIIKPKQPPPTPVETFLADKAHPLCTTFSEPPPIQLSYNVPSQVSAGKQTSLTVTATNKGSQAVTLNRSTLTLEVGTDGAAMFSGPTTVWTVDTKSPSALTTAGTAGVSPAAIATAQLVEQDRDSTLQSYDLAVLGPDPNNTGSSGPLTVQPGKSVTIDWLGTINSAGSTALQIVETLVNGDKCRFMANINRA